MLKLGELQTLYIVKEVEFGVYLAEEKEEQEIKVLLPKKQLPPDKRLHDTLEVFIYRDSKDRLIATRKEPLLKMGELAVLEVAQVSKFGAFLNWGLEKDLFLPYKEQTKAVKPGEKVLVTLYIDKSDRLCATMKVYHYLKWESPYKTGDQVKGRVYQLSERFGAFVAVDDMFSALIPLKECYGNIVVGELLQARVSRVQPDKRLVLSVREKGLLQIEKDAELILKLLDSYEGALPFNDKASPETIKRETNMSKNEFKKAVGYLLKEGMIEIGEKTIRRIY